MTEVRSYHGQPVLKRPVWSWEIPVYFFFGGMAGASAGLAYLSELHGDDELSRRAWAVAVAGLAASPPLLISDLGRPGRFLNMLRMFKVTSPMSVGTWVLSATAASTVVAAANAWTGRFAGPARVARPASAVLGLPLSTYTAALIADDRGAGLAPGAMAAPVRIRLRRGADRGRGRGRRDPAAAGSAGATACTCGCGGRDRRERGDEARARRCRRSLPPGRAAGTRTCHLGLSGCGWCAAGDAGRTLASRRGGRRGAAVRRGAVRPAGDRRSRPGLGVGPGVRGRAPARRGSSGASGWGPRGGSHGPLSAPARAAPDRDRRRRTRPGRARSG